MAEDVKAQVRAFIVQNFYVAAGTELSDDGSLLDQGVVDSTGVLEVIDFLEKTFGIQVEDAEMIPDNLDSVGAIAVFVERKQAR